MFSGNASNIMRYTRETNNLGRHHKVVPVFSVWAPFRPLQSTCDCLKEVLTYVRSGGIDSQFAMYLMSSLRQLRRIQSLPSFTLKRAAPIRISFRISGVSYQKTLLASGHKVRTTSMILMVKYILLDVAAYQPQFKLDYEQSWPKNQLIS